LIRHKLVGKFIQNEGNACPDRRPRAALSVAVPSPQLRRSTRLDGSAALATGRDPPGLVAAEQFGSRPPAGFLLEDIGE